jgi:predicted metal-dependent phosphoesterase TrpH
MIDLHTHSTFSDGSYTPSELAQMASEAGLTAMALTDHDSTKGVAEFLKACEGTGVRGIPGVEISANVDKGTLHMLGFFVDHESEEFDVSLGRIRRGREDRNVEIVKKLCDVGFELTMEEVAAYAGEDVVGRPHFAKAMIEKGYVKDKGEVFNKYLGKGLPCYAERFRFSAEQSISEILKVGGVPVLSHPFTLMLAGAELRNFIGGLADMGLCGMECYYPEHNAARTKEYLGIARDLGLEVSGGSDFHGEINPKIQLGRGFGNLDIPDELVEKLEGRITPAA